MTPKGELLALRLLNALLYHLVLYPGALRADAVTKSLQNLVGRTGSYIEHLGPKTVRTAIHPV